MRPQTGFGIGSFLFLLGLSGMPNLQVDEWLDLARGGTLQLFDGARAFVLGKALFDSGVQTFPQALSPKFGSRAWIPLTNNQDALLVSRLGNSAPSAVQASLL